MVKKYEPTVLSILTKGVKKPEIARELAQNVFLTAWENINQLQHDNFSAWLFTIAFYRLSGYKRKEKSNLIDTYSSVDTIAVNENYNVEDIVSASEELDAILTMRLSEDEQKLVVCLAEGLSGEKISQKLKLPLILVRQRIRRLRNKMRENIAPLLNEEIENYRQTG